MDFLPKSITIDFREEIASALNEFGNRWCKREGVECMYFQYYG